EVSGAGNTAAAEEIARSRETLEVSQPALALRRRSGWEACDSGLLLWRRNFLPLFLFSGFPLAALALALRLSPLPIFVSYAALWWLKPLGDRFSLHVIAVRFFQPLATPWRLFAGLGRELLRALPGDLLWRRFSPWRSARLPVRILEILKGKNYRQRISFLKEGGLGFGFLLQLFCLYLEFAVLAGEIAFISIMLQFWSEEAVLGWEEFITNYEAFVFCLWCFNQVLIESLFVAMGFGLYINSRVAREGWDIQLLFAGAARSARRGGENGLMQGAAKILLVCVFLFALFPGGVLAEESSPQESIPYEELKEVLSSPDFGGEEETWGIRFRREEEEKDTPSADISFLWEYLAGIREFFGKALRVVLAIIIAAAACFTIFWLYKTKKRKSFFGGDTVCVRGVFRDLPEDADVLLEKAEALHARGDLRGAWAACLRAARAAYTASRGLVFPAEATEYNCLSLVRRADGDASGGFARLVSGWIQTAYAGRLPPAGAFEEAVGFCRSVSLYETQAPKRGESPAYDEEGGDA
ncbi:MAG: hypothetical protein FWG35_07760, partial [Spirochaetaceae bacterium]|nr:hypothetical protein [Spirochaetaceae bacterium]